MNTGRLYRDLASARFTRLRRLRMLALGPVGSIGKMLEPKEEQMRGRPLTYDEQKATDAAFAGKPFNPDWSGDARVVYDGIVDALSACHADCELARIYS